MISDVESDGSQTRLACGVPENVGIRGHMQLTALTCIFSLTFSHISEIISNFPMAPRKAALTSLTMVEYHLFLIAACLNTAIQYQEANPSKDNSNFNCNLAEEVVSPTSYSNYGCTDIIDNRKIFTLFMTSFHSQRLCTTACMAPLLLLRRHGSKRVTLPLNVSLDVGFDAR